MNFDRNFPLFFLAFYFLFYGLCFWLVENISHWIESLGIASECIGLQFEVESKQVIRIYGNGMIFGSHWNWIWRTLWQNDEKWTKVLSRIHTHTHAHAQQRYTHLQCVFSATYRCNIGFECCRHLGFRVYRSEILWEMKRNFCSRICRNLWQLL